MSSPRGVAPFSDSRAATAQIPRPLARGFAEVRAAVWQFALAYAGEAAAPLASARAILGDERHVYGYKGASGMGMRSGAGWACRRQGGSCAQRTRTHRGSSASLKCGSGLRVLRGCGMRNRSETHFRSDCSTLLNTIR